MSQPSIPGYRIVSSLSESNRAQVFLAEQQSLQRLVALKVLNGDISTNAAQRQRVIEEGKAAARLTHPNLLSVFDIGEAGGRDYIATEYVSGGTLRDRLNQGPMSAERALVFARDLATGLKFLHSQGFLHRDIKPTNVFFREDGTALLGEAGMARAASMKTPENEQIAFGSPHYMSPERAQAMPSDGRSDQYSLGVVIWEALTGKPPFDADDPFQVAIKHITEPVPALPMPLAWMQPIMGRCLAKNPEQRFAQTADLLAAIEALLQSRGVNAMAKERFSAPTPVGMNRPDDVEITQPIPAMRSAPPAAKETEMAATAVMTKLDQSILSTGTPTAIVEPVRGTPTRPMAPPIPAQTMLQQQLPNLEQTAIVQPVRPQAPPIPAQTVLQNRPVTPSSADTVAAPAFVPVSAETIAAPAFAPASAATVAAPAFTPPAANVAPTPAFAPPAASAFVPPGGQSGSPAQAFHAHTAQRPKTSSAAGWLIWLGVLGLICAAGLAWWLFKASPEQSQMETPTPGNQVGANAAPATKVDSTATAPAADADLQALAAKARTAYSNGDYVVPADQSAAFYYQAILKANPEDADAILGMQATAEAVEQQISQALSEGTQSTARAYLDAAWPFFSDRPSLIKLKAQFDAS